MDVNYETDNFLSNRSLETDYNESSTVEYYIYLSGEPVTNVLNEADYFDWRDWDGNLWALFDERYLQNNLGWTIALVLTYSIIFFIGFVGNCMVILVVIKWPQMRTITNMFIMNLAVADLLLIIFCVPPELLHKVFLPWTLGSVMCKIVRCMELVSMCATAYSLAAISLDRCKAIFRPVVPPRGFSKRQALLAIFLIWAVSLALVTPYMVIFEDQISGDIAIVCRNLWGQWHEDIYIYAVPVFILYFLPLILIIISNIIIWWTVSKRKSPEECASASRVDRMHRKTRQSVGKMLGIVTLAFLLSWLPLYYYMTMENVVENISLWEYEYLLPMALLLGFSNSSINPVLYAFLSAQFRQMFKSLLPKWLRCIQMKGNSCEKSCTNDEAIA